MPQTIERPKLKVGDKIVVYGGMKRDRPVRIATISRVTPTLAIYGDGDCDRCKITMRAAMPGEIAIAEAYLEDVRKERELRDAAVAARAADPRLSLADSLRGWADSMPWDKLTLEQLTTIRGWMEEARK